MRRLLKWVGITISSIVTLIVLAVAAVYAVSSSRLRKDYPTRVTSVEIPSDSAASARGRHIAEAVSTCMNCHGDNLAGKVLSSDRVMGRLAAANLTRGRGGVAGGYTDADWVRAIRHGVGTDGRALVFMPSNTFFHMSDQDLGALIAWVKTVPPVDAVLPAKKVGPLARALSLFVGYPLLPAREIPTAPQSHPSISPGVSPAYGKYLVDIGGCRGCHGDALSGGVPMGDRKTPNLTPGGLGQWTEASFLRAMRTGVKPDGRVLSAQMPWPYYRKMTDDELRAIWAYLHSLSPVKTGEKG